MQNWKERIWKTYVPETRVLFYAPLIGSVHCAGLSDVQGACLYVVLAHTAGVPDKLKAIHSVIT
jgi:hypothetical protein